MAIYALSDPHLSFSTDKPMDIFGQRWENHAERIRENWIKTVGESDTVIIGGDISWATGLCEAKEDLAFIDSLPGKKIIGKGNHDYWWATKRKLDAFISENGFSTISFLYNNAYLCEDTIICGTRGWIREFGVKSEDERLIKREAARLEISLREGEKLVAQNPGAKLRVFLHYPPVLGEFLNLDILDVLYKFGVEKVYYGHLHNIAKGCAETEYIGIKLELTSCDYVDFTPIIVD